MPPRSPPWGSEDMPEPKKHSVQTCRLLPWPCSLPQSLQWDRVCPTGWACQLQSARLLMLLLTQFSLPFLLGGLLQNTGFPIVLDFWGSRRSPFPLFVPTVPRAALLPACILARCAAADLQHPGPTPASSASSGPSARIGVSAQSIRGGLGLLSSVRSICFSTCSAALSEGHSEICPVHAHAVFC